MGADDLPLFAHSNSSGAQLAAQGMATAEAHANAVETKWSERAHAMLLAFVSERPATASFMAEEVRTFAEARGLPAPPDPRAWGGVMQRASRAKLIVGNGFDISKNRQAHCRPTKLWRAR